MESAEKLQQIESFVSRIEKLPSLPSLYLELLGELRSGGASAKRVGAIISKDIGMTAKILQLANSAYFGFARKVNSVDRAVVLLGLECVKDLVLVIQVFAQFDRTKMASSPVFGLWRHSTSCSTIARRIATAARASRDCIDQATTAAFLHDIGKLVLANNRPAEYRKIYDVACEQNRSLYELERETLGVDHAEIGGYLLGRWGLSDSLVRAVRFHHDPMAASSNCFEPLTAVHIADYFENMAQRGGGNWIPAGINSEYLESIGAQDQLDTWQEMCREEEQPPPVDRTAVI